MAVMPRQSPNTVVSSSGLLNVYAAEIERVVAGTFGNLTNTSRPRFLLTRTSALSVNNVLDTAVPWQIAVADPRVMWNASTPDIVTVRDAGYWILFGQTRWTVAANGTRAGKILKNGTDPTIAGVSQCTGSQPGTTVGETTVSLFTGNSYALGDLLRLNAWQNSGGTLNTLTDFGGTFFGGIWIGP